MKFDRATAIGVILGFFVLSPVIIMIVQGSLRWTFNYAVNGIIGMTVAIIIGFLFGWIGGKQKNG